MSEITHETVRQYFPRVVSWVTGMEALIQEKGQALLPLNRNDAERIGVRQIDRIRVAVCDHIPLPDDAELRGLFHQLGFVTAETHGMTFSHGILLKNGAYDRELIAHELVHVWQYEQLGGIEPFLHAYVREVVFPPYYPNGPLEKEAARIAVSICRSTDLA